MNAQRYRLIFNRHRAQIMAVAENVAACSKDARSSSSSTPVGAEGDTLFLAKLRVGAFAVLLVVVGNLVVALPAAAQAVAYKAAPASQRPTILNAANGVPLVNIQTPSAAGVSHNAYSQFDVQAQGLILNNARNNVATQLGGWVQGNPWLARGTARVILNEVIAANPSQLLGYVEVAGNPAQVVIANPAGVTCNGCGFINATRATLTTGTPLVSGGSLEGYRVEGGTMRIEGAGLDASRVGYTDIIARAVEVNAGLWGQSLKVTAGTNVVDAGNTQAAPIAPAVGRGPVPAFAIDVAQLGGMYAGKIVMVGTEVGVGVRNAGHIGASAGEVRLGVDGKLTNDGEIASNGALTIDAASLENRKLIDGRNTRIEVAGSLDNLGAGRIYGDDLGIAAKTLNNHADGAEAPVIAARGRLDFGVEVLSNRNAGLILSAGDMAIGGALDTGNRATGAATLVHNHGATLEAFGKLDLSAVDIRNTNSEFITRTVTEGSKLVQEVQPEGWPQRHDVIYFPTIFDHRIEGQIYVVDGVVRGGFEDYSFYQYTADTSATQLVSSKPGSILAGGNIGFSGNLENSDSRVIAGGSLVHRNGTLANHATSGVRTTTYSGWVQFRDWDGRKEKLKFEAQVGFNPAPTVTTFDLGAAAWTAGSTPARVGNVPTLGSLYRPSIGTHHHIETDPRFANYRLWLSSDHMLQQLALDPATMQKRLGDGFYEQRLIAEQIGQLTGRRFLAGFSDDEAQYRALMDAGITLAKAWRLIPGVALTAEQMARLTTDMVWLVEQNVTLPDGSVHKALVPQLYAQVRQGDLAPGGALLAAEKIEINSAGDLINGGTLAGRQLVTLSADNLRNLGGRIVGKEIELDASQDIDIRGGSLEAGSRLDLSAGRNLDIASTTRASENRQSGEFSRTNIDRVAALHLRDADGRLRLAAAGDVTLLAAQLSSAGSTRIDAGGQLALGTVAIEEKNHAGGKGYRNESGSRTEIGTRISAQGDIVLTSGQGSQDALERPDASPVTNTGRIVARAAEVSSVQGHIQARAGAITLEAGEASRYSDITQQKTKRGMLSSKSTSQRDAFADTTALASTFSGEKVTLEAGRDLTLKGSNVAATQDATLTAGRDLMIEAATETHAETHTKTMRQSGVFGSGGIGFTIGSRMNSTDQQSDSTTAAKSTVGSVEGKVTLEAGRAYRQVGSDVIAVKGDIEIAAQQVAIVEARETSRTTVEQKSQQSGLTIAITSPVISAIQTAQQMSEAAKDTQDNRMKALAAANTVLAGKNAYDAIQAGQGSSIGGKDNQIATGKTLPDGTPETRDATAADQAGGINLSISIGGSKSSSKSTQTSDTAAGSSLTAGGEIKISAKGAGADSDLLIQGSDLKAGKNLSLEADDELRLLAARNTAEQKSNNSNSSASVGISFGTDGFLINVGASGGRGKADGQDLTHRNTHLEAGESLKLKSGGDTTLKGAVAKGEKVVAEVGGDLKIESLQDSRRYDAKQQSLGVSVSIGYGKVGGSVSASQSKVSSDYLSVVEQSGLQAGDGGFDVKVKGDTDLKGAVIASTQTAIDTGKNRFETDGELSTRDLHNKAEYKAKSVSVNVGSGMSFDGKLTPGGSGAGLGKDSGQASSTTVAGISGIAGNKDVRTGDPETGIKPIFDQAKVQKDIDAQTKITQQFGQQASKAVGEYANSKENELRLRANQAQGSARDELLREANSWAEGGVNRVLLHTAIGGLGGGTGGALGAAASSTMTPILAEQIAKLDVPFELKIALIQTAGTAIGAAAGGTAGAAAGLNETANNYALMLRGAEVAGQAARLGLDKISAAQTAVLQSCVNNAACRELISKALPVGAMAWLINQNTPMQAPPSDLVKQIPGFGEGDQPKPPAPLVTPMPDPKRIQEVYGTPPLQNPEQLKSWLANALEGYPADEAEKWAKGLITTLPATQQTTWKDFILQAVQDNAISGSRREREVTADLQALYPNGSVQNQQYLRDRSGNVVIDPLTGTARRLDHVVVVDGKVVDVVETTSLTARKNEQIAHENEVRLNGGVFVRDRNTGELVEVPSISRIERRP